MAVYYINGTSNSGATFGQSGYFYPLYLTAAEANSSSDNSLGTSHAHTFEEAPNITFYMPVEDAAHAQASAPTGNYGGEVYISYTSPIAETDVEEIGTGVLAGDTFNSWRKKTNDVARESISNKASIGSVDTRLTRLLSVTGGENNIMSLTSSDNITGEKEFEGIVKFSAAANNTSAIQIGSNGKVYVANDKFVFDKDIDLHVAGAEIKATRLNIPAGGTTNYSGVEYTWPSSAPAAGEFLKSNNNNSLEWSTVTAGDLAQDVEAFFIEDPFPIGSIMPHSGTGAPPKYLLCDGQDYNTFDYKELHAVISNIYGDTGTAFQDGVTNVSGVTSRFRVPDLRARVPIGLGTNTDANGISANFRALGDTDYAESGVVIDGEYKHTLLTTEMPSHTHEFSNQGGLGKQFIAFSRDDITPDTDSEGENGTGYTYGPAGNDRIYTIQDTGGGQSHNVVQPFVVLNYIIKAEPSLIVEQKVRPGNGIFINDQATNLTNLLNSTAAGEATVENTISLNVDSNDFEFDIGSKALKLNDNRPYRAGEIIQFKLDETTDTVKTIEQIPTDDTVPLITEGEDAGFSITMTPTSTSSLIRATLKGQFRNQAAGRVVTTVLFEGSTAVGVSNWLQPNYGTSSGHTNVWYFNPASTTEQVYTVRFGGNQDVYASYLETGNGVDDVGLSGFNGLNKATLFLEEIAQ